MTNKVDIVVSGYGLLEGPRHDSKNGLYFCDSHNGGVFRLDGAGKVETIIPKRRGVGGIALHADGGLVVSGRNICHVNNEVSNISKARNNAINEVSGISKTRNHTNNKVSCTSKA